MTCTCRSYNLPERDDGTDPEVILDPRKYFEHTTKTVCVDKCISEQIEGLWQIGVETCSCCCGHNRAPPSVYIKRPDDMQRAIEYLSKTGRQWSILI